MPSTDPPQIGYAASGGQLFVAVASSATHQAAHTAQRVVDDFLAHGRELPVVILDLADCAWVDSTFAGWMIRLRKRLSERGGRLVVSRCAQACRSSLDTMGLSGLFEFQALAVPPKLTPLPCTPAGDAAALKLMIDAHEDLAAACPENQRVFARIAEELRQELNRRQNH